MVGKRRALVIGNGAYAHAPRLTNPGHDAQAMAEVLARLGFEVTLGIDLSRTAMEDHFIGFESTVAGAEAGLFFYAGHGLQVKGSNYLIPVDVEIKQEAHLQYRAFALDAILGHMAQGARSSLIFLDACRDNPFARSLQGGFGAGGQSRDLVRSGLAEVKASAGSFIAFATSPSSVALDGLGRNSPFTSALLQHIETADQSVSDLMISVRQSVYKETGGKQEPWDQSSLRERFCFNVGAVPQSRDEPWTVDSRTIEHTRWMSVRESGDIGDLEEFIVQFPGGIYQSDAQRLASNRINACNDAGLLELFRKRFPTSPRRTLADQQLQAMAAGLVKKAWAPLKAKGTKAGLAELRGFIALYPKSSEAAEARAVIAAISKARWAKNQRSEDKAVARSFLADFPDTPETSAARKRLMELDQAAPPPGPVPKPHVNSVTLFTTLAGPILLLFAIVSTSPIDRSTAQFAVVVCFLTWGILVFVGWMLHRAHPDRSGRSEELLIRASCLVLLLVMLSFPFWINRLGVLALY